MYINKNIATKKKKRNWGAGITILSLTAANQLSNARQKTKIQVAVTFYP